jgi:hypothetical protein
MKTSSRRPIAQTLAATALILMINPVGAAQQTQVPVREWSPALAREILDRTQTTRLAPDLAHLTAGERIAVGKLPKRLRAAAPPQRAPDPRYTRPAQRRARPRSRHALSAVPGADRDHARQ